MSLQIHYHARVHTPCVGAMREGSCVMHLIFSLNTNCFNTDEQLKIGIVHPIQVSISGRHLNIIKFIDRDN